MQRESLAAGEDRNLVGSVHGSHSWVSYTAQATMEAEGETFADRISSAKRKYERLLQHYLDRTVPYTLQRWSGFGFLLLVFLLRVVLLQGFYVVAYALGIYLLNLFLAFLTPRFDPAWDGEDMDDETGLSLPTRNDEEFRPFIRRLPEFKFWLSAVKALTIGLTCTFFTFFDIPVFWPILLLYFIILFSITMKRQIMHMIKFRYLPFDFGKKKYAGAGVR